MQQYAGFFRSTPASRTWFIYTAIRASKWEIHDTCELQPLSGPSVSILCGRLRPWLKSSPHSESKSPPDPRQSWYGIIVVAITLEGSVTAHIRLTKKQHTAQMFLGAWAKWYEGKTLWNISFINELNTKRQKNIQNKMNIWTDLPLILNGNNSPRYTCTVCQDTWKLAAAKILRLQSPLSCFYLFM